MRTTAKLTMSIPFRGGESLNVEMGIKIESTTATGINERMKRLNGVV
jgi:hypothetical protein